MSENLREYLGAEDPMQIFQLWFAEAKDKAYENPMNEATGFTLATVDGSGVISTRVVLLKDFTSTGFRFFTSYSSKKAKAISENPKVAANFYWPQTFKQIKIYGSIARTSRKISEDYWNSRPKGSQISQLLSDQSQPIDSRQSLENKHQTLNEQYANESPECPEDWGGYEITPEKFEFWVGRDNRLHDRLVFEGSEGHWTLTRLQP